MTVIVSANFNDGTAGGFTSTVDPDSDLSITQAAALASTAYGGAVLIDDTTATYWQCALAGVDTSGKARSRFYIDPNTLTMANNDMLIVHYLFRNSLSFPIIAVNFRYTTAGGYAIALQVFGDTANPVTSYYAITDAPHYVEVDLVRASDAVAADGTGTLYIDGASKQVLTLDNYDKFDGLRYAWLGACSGVDAGTSGTFYLDELVVNNDGSEIGPVTASFQAAWASGSNAMIGA